MVRNSFSRHSGLIEGAHEGVGIGDRFLESCRTDALLHIVSAQEERKVGKAYKTVEAVT